VRLLIDTSVFLEIILGQERAPEAQSLLSRVQEHQFFISVFGLHSIGLLLFRKKRHETFRQFLSDMIVQMGTRVVSLTIEDMESVLATARDFGLDFDDSYQYAVAEKLRLTLVSFDGDFDRTARGRKTPDQVPAG
jgi:predicted nucleic acid-binding protein